MNSLEVRGTQQEDIQFGSGPIKVIFHIGSAKTGSSSIQQFLSRNRDGLLEQGILYPRMNGSAKNHKIMAVPAWEHVQRSLVRKLGSDIDAAREKAEKAWGLTRRQVREHRPETVVISSEFFFTAPRAEVVGELIRRYFAFKFVDELDLEFFVYLRRPSEWYTSTVQQNFKGSHVLKPMEPQPLAALLDRYAAFGPVIARRFDRSALKDGSVVADFCDRVGIRAEDLDHPPAHTNTTLSAEGAILMQEYRRTHHPERNKVLSRDTKRYKRFVSWEEAQHPGLYTKPRLKPRFAQVLDRETDDLRALRERYGVDLVKDHGVAPAPPEEIAGLKDAAEVYDYDPDLLERMRAAVAARAAEKDKARAKAKAARLAARAKAAAEAPANTAAEALDKPES